MYWEQAVHCDAETDIGLRRKNNEDAFCIRLCQSEEEWRRSGHLFVVADGMGGHAVGELASRIAVETIPHTFLKSTASDPKTSLHEAILAANRSIYERGTQNADFLHMGTTCTALALSQWGVIIGHIGDSRAYRIRRDRIDQLTFDHSLEWELERKQGGLEGLPDLSQHRNIITRSLGPEEVIDVDLEGPFPILPADAFLLCSDGLSNQVSDAELGAIIRELPPRRATKLLIQLANIRGGPDNSTAVVIRVGDPPANLTPPVPLEIEDDQRGLGWSWLAGFCVGAMLLVIGFAMLTMGHPRKGSVLLALTIGGLIMLLVGSIRQQRALRKLYPEETHTRYWRPHRTAIGLSSQELYERLLDTDAQLYRSAKEDGWDVDWKDHEQAINRARQAAQEKRYSKAVRDISHAIGIIMDQLPRTNAATGTTSTMD